MKWQPDKEVKMYKIEDSLLSSSETLSQRFLMLIQAVSGIRALTSQEMNGFAENELLDRLLTILIENLDMERCSVFLLKNDRLHCAAGKDWNEYVHKSKKVIHRDTHDFPIGHGITGLVAQKGKVYHCKNCRMDENFLSVVSSDKDVNPGSLISAPISIGDTVLGVLNISHPEADFFHLWQEHIVAVHANILGQMLHNHRLINSMQQEVEKQTKELENALWVSENLKSQYETLSLVDDLSQLHNRRYFFTEAPRALAHSWRFKEPFSLLLLDLDDFKMINDNHGHEAGDHVIKDVGALLKSQTRTGDVVARMGGEEFVFVLQGTDINGAKIFAERIRKSVEKLTWYLDHVTFDVTMSIGISGLNDREEDEQDMLKTLLNEADKALYKCKSTGKNRVISFWDKEDL